VLLVIVWCLQWYENILCIAIDESLCWHASAVEEIWYSRLNEWVSPKREYQKPSQVLVQAVAQATSSNFEREAILLRKGGIA